MLNDTKLKAEERELWRTAAIKALEFVPIDTDGKAYGPDAMAQRAAGIATALVQARRDVFNELDIWDDADGDGERLPDGKSLAFDEGLVERLAQVAYGTFFDKLEDPKPWAEISLVTQARWTLSVRAILSELASMPCELPTADEIFSECTLQTSIQAVSVEDFIRIRVAPIVAASFAARKP